MNINKLKLIMSPPLRSSSVLDLLDYEHHWVYLEEKIHFCFPKDYKDFIQLYGSGVIDNFLTIFNPFSINLNDNLVYQIEVKRKIYEELKDFGEVLPYEFFPNVDGIIPFGSTDNGDLLFFKLENGIVLEKIIINEARSDTWNEFDLSMVEFLYKLLNQNIVCELFPKSFPSEKKPISFISF